MSKVIRVTAVLSLIAEVLYFLVGQLLGTVLGIPLFAPHGIIDSFSDSSAMTLAIILVAVSLFGAALYSIIMVGLDVYLIVTAKSESENVVLEILGFIFFAVLAPLSTYINVLFNWIVSHFGGQVSLVMLSSARSMPGYFAILNNIAFALLFIALSFSICRKKFEAVEVYTED